MLMEISHYHSRQREERTNVLPPMEHWEGRLCSSFSQSQKNDNNRLTAKKLRLYHMTSGEALLLDHTFETWIAKEVCPFYNGGNVILEYLNDEEQFSKNVDSYFK